MNLCEVVVDKVQGNGIAMVLDFFEKALVKRVNLRMCIPKKKQKFIRPESGPLVSAWPELKKIIINERPPFMVIIERDGKITKYDELQKRH